MKKYMNTTKLNISYPPFLLPVLVNMERICRFVFALKDVIHPLCICLVPCLDAMVWDTT